MEENVEDVATKLLYVQFVWRVSEEAGVGKYLSKHVEWPIFERVPIVGEEFGVIAEDIWAGNPPIRVAHVFWSQNGWPALELEPLTSEDRSWKDLLKDGYEEGESLMGAELQDVLERYLTPPEFS